ncbi:MAG: adenine phosphoribosyltransferase [Tepidanaerobacteraceae bacterium]|jgi:adenine phosphoribosyltransferase|nr:adenine phosphoribosyltransferase [Tepidanaerobacter sp.]HQA59962.1 adenine phosphoribosyltransferase [Tepidanaerobacteraceae bacterium]HQE04840.1 adenine phosphoribosyltransferase [Tepidanaerobacteraceae bacterium]
MDLKEKIRVIEDFPKKGISFKDITTLIKDGEAFKEAIKSMAELIRDKEVDLITGPEARGFIIGAPLAYELGVGFIPTRKKGKLPGKTIKAEYQLEYGSDIIEMHEDAIKAGQKVVVVDDLLATGGTIISTIELVEKLGGKVAAVVFLIELEDLKGREQLSDYEVYSLVKY